MKMIVEGARHLCESMENDICIPLTLCNNLIDRIMND